MIFGSTPFKSNTTEYLLYEIYNKIPSFKHDHPVTKKSIEVSEKLKELIMALINPNPEDRMSHAQLFATVVENANFEREYSGSQSDISINQSGIT